MADLGTIGIAIEVRGREALQQVENDMNNVERSTKSAALSMAVFERAGLKSAETFKYMGQETKNWLRDQQRILSIRQESERMATEQAQAEARLTAELEKQQRLAQTQKSETAFALGKQRAEEEARQLAQTQAEMLRLEAMYNKVSVAARVYQQAQDSLSRALELGVIDADQQQAKLQELAVAYQRVGNSADNAQAFINRFGENAQVSGRGLNQFGMIAQQVGYQVGDFFVQVQSGTNVLVAFGQQATQLAGLIPGAWGAAFGIGISLATALGAAWMRTTEEVEKGADRQKQAYENLIETIERLRLERQMEASGVESLDEQLQLNEIVKLKKEQTELQKQLNELGLQQSSKGFVEAKELREQKQALQEQIDTKQAAINILEAERLETERINRLNQIRTNQVLEELAERERLKQAHADQVMLMGQARAEQLRMTSAAQEALDKYGKMRTVAAGLADELARGADETFRMSSLNYGKIQNTAGSGPDAARSEVWANMPNPFGVLAGGAGGVRQDPSSGGGGGGGAAQTTVLENKMEEIYRYLELDKYLMEQETIAYEQRQDVLRSALENKLITLQEYNELEKAIATQHQQDLANITLAGQQQNLTYAADFFGALAGVAAAGGDKMTKAVRVFSAAQALINSYLAYTQVIADPTLPWFAKIPAALGVLSAGLGMVNAIKGGGSSSGGGAGSTGGRGSATVAPKTAAAPTPQTVFIDSIDPKSLYSGETLINLFEAFYNENDKRGKVFLVAR